MPKLLLADDSVTIRKVVELTFADEGIDVISVADGDAAMQKFVETEPDIVLVDVEMPGQNGYKICEIIKQEAATRHVPVLLLVGSFEPFDQTEAERVGADGFLTKPFHSIRDLVARVKDLLEPATGGQPAGPETEDIEHLYQTSFREADSFNAVETDEDLFLEASMDDQMVETVQPAGSYLDNGSQDATAFEEDVGILDIPGIRSARAEVAPQALDSYGHTGVNELEADPGELSSPFAAPAMMDQAGQVAEAAPSPPVESSAAEPSDEVIALIAKRVVEKLSDRVIRDIAQEAVPRIAEKLIREALEDEKKN